MKRGRIRRNPSLVGKLFMYIKEPKGYLYRATVEYPPSGLPSEAGELPFTLEVCSHCIDDRTPFGEPPLGEAWFIIGRKFYRRMPSQRTLDRDVRRIIAKEKD